MPLQRSKCSLLSFHALGCLHHFDRLPPMIEPMHLVYTPLDFGGCINFVVFVVSNDVAITVSVG